ncbi:receptor-type tyrosine-protein phosphatase alpha-like [Glandiceps talaboti]
MRQRSVSQLGKKSIRFSKNQELDSMDHAPRTYPAIPNERLPQVFAQNHANGNRLFYEQYDYLPRSSRQVTVEASNRPVNKRKNRYVNILAYDQSRVTLSVVDNDPDTDYINACYVDGYKSPNKFIASQGPKDETVDDFWRMVWEQESATIVMVTKLFESNREKCAKYWPDEGSEEYGDLEVTALDTAILADYTIRTFNICHLSMPEDMRKITQLHYVSWPDFGIPSSPIGMLNFIKRARAIDMAADAKTVGPMVVHCSAGVGRTGTFIVLDAMMDQMAEEGKADVFAFISKIRGQRNCLVQADVQYVFIHQALAEHYLYGNTEIETGNWFIHWSKLNQKVPNSDKTGLEVEYQKLTEVPIENVVLTEATQKANRTKNRLVSTVPYDHNRVRLIREIGKEHSDYINASLIDGYRQKGTYIAAQAPLESTVDDFWRMIWECRSGSVVMMTKLEEGGQGKCYPYWPMEIDEAATYGNIAVQKKLEESDDGFTIQNFHVTDTKSGESRTIRHFQYTAWPEIGTPSHAGEMLSMLGRIQRQQQKTGNRPIIVHCSTGGGRTGVFCALSIVIERMKAEAIVDIFQTYKMLRQQRNNIIQSIDQYHFVYKSIMDYLHSFDDYDNFKNRVV